MSSIVDIQFQALCLAILLFLTGFIVGLHYSSHNIPLEVIFIWLILFFLSFRFLIKAFITVFGKMLGVFR